MGAMPWGTHFCHFYETKDDLLDTLVPYFKAGLDDGEFCVWVVSEPLTEAEAWIALGRAVLDLARHARSSGSGRSGWPGVRCDARGTSEVMKRRRANAALLVPCWALDRLGR